MPKFTKEQLLAQVEELKKERKIHQDGKCYCEDNAKHLYALKDIKEKMHNIASTLNSRRS